MDSMAQPLGRLQADVSWFARATELRLLYVRTSADLIGPAIALIEAQESNTFNKSLFFRFDDPELAAGPPVWNDRSKRLYAQYAAKRPGLAEAGIVVGDIGPEPPSQPNGLASFSSLLGKILDAQVAPLHGAVLIFAPMRSEAGCRLLSELPTIARSWATRGVRYIVVERDADYLASLPAALGPQTLICDATVDAKALAKDLARFAGVTPAGAAPVTGVRWKGPGAGPDVVPPPRVGAVPPATDEALLAEGLSPAYVNGGAEKLKELAMGAALLLKDGKTVEAVRMQAEAAALCEQFAMPKLHVVNLMVLASYCLAAQAPGKAVEVYQRAQGLAMQHKLLDQAAQIELYLGMMDVREKRPTQAIAHYRKAGELAEQAKAPSLAVEAWRMAGQLALDNKSNEASVTCWKRAMAVIEPLTPAEAKATSAPEVARGLASLLRKNRLHAQADSLEETAYRIEQGLPPDAPVARA